MCRATNTPLSKRFKDNITYTKYAFVLFSNIESADRCINTLNKFSMHQELQFYACRFKTRSQRERKKIDNLNKMESILNNYKPFPEINGNIFPQAVNNIIYYTLHTDLRRKRNKLISKSNWRFVEYLRNPNISRVDRHQIAKEQLLLKLDLSLEFRKFRRFFPLLVSIYDKRGIIEMERLFLDEEYFFNETCKLLGDLQFYNNV